MQHLIDCATVFSGPCVAASQRVAEWAGQSAVAE